MRYQINMALGSIKTIANVEKFNNMILPLLWTEIVSTLSKTKTSEKKTISTKVNSKIMLIFVCRGFTPYRKY